jgi:hypothetical protein
VGPPPLRWLLQLRVAVAVPLQQVHSWGLLLPVELLGLPLAHVAPPLALPGVVACCPAWRLVRQASCKGAHPAAQGAMFYSVQLYAQRAEVIVARSLQAIMNVAAAGECSYIIFKIGLYSCYSVLAHHLLVAGEQLRQECVHIRCHAPCTP